ncbi:MAG: Gfo/Idh/MocA family oxidoreductase [Oscillospiraceae bacterium]|jgi:predicted dehydrogenase|nr:Gfo/Idh/MocA family oxidoreductase [Oscillospiraceae bacterium]
MRYCLIGCGRVSPEHIRAAQKNGLEITGLCDTVPANKEENLAFAADALRGVPLFADYRQMLRNARPELVAIATPSGYHAEMALDCIEAGCHVIIEKPIAMHLTDAQKILEAGRRKGVVVANNLQNRFNPAVQMLRRAVEVGRFGRILSATLHLRWWRGAGYYAQAAWRGTKALDGGAMMNQSIHGIDLLNWMLGSRPKTLTALKSTLVHPIECEDIAIAALRYDNGALGSLECMTVMYPGAQEETLQISGTKGCARLGGTAGHVVELWRFDDMEADEEALMRERYGANPASVYGHGHSLLYADVCRAIHEDGQPLVDAQEGMNALSVVLAAYESAETGKPYMFA